MITTNNIYNKYSMIIIHMYYRYYCIIIILASHPPISPQGDGA